MFVIIYDTILGIKFRIKKFQQLTTKQNQERPQQHKDNDKSSHNQGEPDKTLLHQPIQY
jgi:hypothetical protein